MKAFKAFIKPFQAAHRSVKIEIWVIFFFLSGIGKLRVKGKKERNLHWGIDTNSEINNGVYFKTKFQLDASHKEKRSCMIILHGLSL